MNGDSYGFRQPTYQPALRGSRNQSVAQADFPPTKVLMDGYRSPFNDGDEQQPRFNPVSCVIR